MTSFTRPSYLKVPFGPSKTHSFHSPFFCILFYVSLLGSFVYFYFVTDKFRTEENFLVFDLFLSKDLYIHKPLLLFVLSVTGSKSPDSDKLI